MRELLEDPRRTSSLHICEGREYRPHICRLGFDLNEVLYPRKVFQKLPRKKQAYFWSVYNCSINCRDFHIRYGHTKAYRQWHLEHMVDIYGLEKIANWCANAPLKMKLNVSQLLAI